MNKETAEGEAKPGKVQEGLEALLKVQDKDVKLRRLAAELEQKPIELQDLKQGLSDFHKRVEDSKVGMKKHTAEKNALEVDLEAKEELILKYEGQLLLLKTNEEYKAKIKEIDNLKQGKGPIEDKILTAMESIEVEKVKVKKEEEILKQEEGKVALREKAIQEEIQGLEVRVTEVQKEKDGLISAVNPALLDRYNLIFENKHDCAIVSIEHGACGGCHMAITPQISNEVKRGHDLVICENCARILYLPPK